MFVTILSDFGLRDVSAGVAKGLLGGDGVTLVELSHEVAAYDLQQAAYMLCSAYKSFPVGSCHVVLVDVFYAKRPMLILAEKEGHYFLVPDNGVLSLMFGDIGEARRCYGSVEEDDLKDWLRAVGDTIHTIQHNPERLQDLPLSPTRDIRKNHALKELTNGVECRVIYIDHYGNAVLNIKRNEFEAVTGGRPFTINIARGDDVHELSLHYKDVEKGHVLCRFNGAGYLEIGVKYGKASELFGLKVGEDKLAPRVPVRITTIHF